MVSPTALHKLRKYEKSIQQKNKSRKSSHKSPRWPLSRKSHGRKVSLIDIKLGKIYNIYEEDQTGNINKEKANFLHDEFFGDPFFLAG